MARNWDTLSGALLMLAALSGSVGAHVGDIVYPIYELPTSDLPDLHDGTLENWEEVLPNSSIGIGDFTTMAGEPAHDLEEFAFRAYLAWHHRTQRIYLAFDRFDDVILDEVGFESVGFSIDGDHSGGVILEIPDSPMPYPEAASSNAQIYHAFPTEEGGLLLPSGSSPWLVRPPWGDAGGYRGLNLSTMEAVVTPWDEVGEGAEDSQRSDLIGGSIIGFSISMVDSDEAGRMRQVFSLAGFPNTGGTSLSADYFVDGELIPCYRGDCSGATTAVSQDSWGRIKASLR